MVRAVPEILYSYRILSGSCADSVPAHVPEVKMHMYIVVLQIGKAGMVLALARSVHCAVQERKKVGFYLQNIE
jgi:hypothetical protein